MRFLIVTSYLKDPVDQTVDEAISSKVDVDASIHNEKQMIIEPFFRH